LSPSRALGTEAHGLFEHFASDASVTPRGALATGELVTSGGDYYGPIVNLAARVAQLAVPHELLVTAEVVAHAAASGLRFSLRKGGGLVRRAGRRAGRGERRIPALSPLSATTRIDGV
jgi:class 3 adenylate cyclase